MSIIHEGVMQLPLSGAWFRLPDQGDDVETQIDALLAEFAPLDEEPRRQLEAGLRIVTGLAHSLAPGARTSHALILQPDSGRVQALLSIRLSRVTADAYDNYLTTARAFSGDERIEVIKRTVEEVELPDGRGILSHDFTLAVQREGVADPALERCFLAYFPSGFETAIEFTLLTQNLALFDDAPSYLLAVAAGERPVVPGREAAE
ncbi:MAG: hypothetical protein ACTHMQ_13125 [Protaetiibacter sp.]